MKKFSKAFADGYRQGWYDSAPDDGSRTSLDLELRTRVSKPRTRTEYERGYRRGYHNRRNYPQNTD